MLAAARLVRCGKVGAVTALAFFMSLGIVEVAEAHYDGDISQRQHRYRVTSGQSYVDKPAQACQDYKATLPTRTYVGVNWDSSAKQWICQLVVTSTGAPSNVTFAENHCDGWDQDSASSCATASDPCALLIGVDETLDTNRTPYGINVPDDPSLPEPWRSHRGCSLKIQGFTPNGLCTRATYVATGAGHIDEDGRPNATNQGDPFSSSIPDNCDPATGRTTSNGPTVGASTCAQRAGAATQLTFEYNDQTYLDPPPVPAWSCVRGCKAVPYDDGGGIERTCLFDETDAEPGSCLTDYRFPFEDHEHFGMCTPGSEAPSLYNPRGGAGTGAGSENPGAGTDGGGGAGTDVTGIEDRLDSLLETFGECDPSRGDICSEGDISGYEDQGDAGLDALDEEAAGDLGRDAAQELEEGNRSDEFEDPLSGWASGAGSGACGPDGISILGVSFEIDLCDWAQLSRDVLYWVFNVLMVFYIFGVWIRLAGSLHIH